MNKLYVNSEVNSADIRKEVVRGREHYVVPSFTLPFDVVMNKIRYSKDQILKCYKGLEDKLAPIGHPLDDNGNPISAYSALAINEYHAGVFNKNVKLDGNRVYVEKWIDIEKAKQHPKGKLLLDHIEARKPVSTSIALNIKKVPVEGKSYEYDAIISGEDAIDHDALLFGENPAAGFDVGVGMVINCEEATSIFTDIDEKTMYNKFMSWFQGLSKDKNLIVNKEDTKVELTKEDIQKLHDTAEMAINALKEANAEKLATNSKVESIEAKLDKITESLQANADKELEGLRKKAKDVSGLAESTINKLDAEELQDLIRKNSKEKPEMQTNSAQTESEESGFKPLDANLFGGK